VKPTRQDIDMTYELSDARQRQLAELTSEINSSYLEPDGSSHVAITPRVALERATQLAFAVASAYRHEQPVLADGHPLSFRITDAMGLTPEGAKTYGAIGLMSGADEGAAKAFVPLNPEERKSLLAKAQELGLEPDAFVELALQTAHQLVVIEGLHPMPKLTRQVGGKDGVSVPLDFSHLFSPEPKISSARHGGKVVDLAQARAAGGRG
jgi:hypothetical protein